MKKLCFICGISYYPWKKHDCQPSSPETKEQSFAVPLFGNRTPVTAGQIEEMILRTERYNEHPIIPPWEKCHFVI